MSVLERKQDGDNRVVTFEFMDDKRTIEIAEACDCYFSVELNKAEFGEFIAELQALHAQMQDSPSCE